MRVYPPNKQTLLHHRQELTDVQKGQIREARGLRKSYTEISKELHIPRSTIVSFFHRFQERGSEENLPHTGRPRKTSASFDRYVIRTAQVDADITNAALRDITNATVLISTIRRRFREDHMRKWKAVEHALLMEKHTAKHLKWARKYLHFTREDWERVFWSDECDVQKDGDGRQVWIFRHQNKHEKYASKNIRGQEKGSGLFQMI
jgi:transposase